MNATLLDCSRRPELLLHAQTLAAVGSVAEALGVEMLIAGTFARDLHTMYTNDLPAERRTEDLDIALALASWRVFQTLRDRLIGSGSFFATPRLHRLRHIGELSVDLLPFGGVETRSRHVHWPPDGGSRMDVFGFQEALASATMVLLPDAVQAKVVSVPAPPITAQRRAGFVAADRELSPARQRATTVGRIRRMDGRRELRLRRSRRENGREGSRAVA